MTALEGVLSGGVQNPIKWDLGHGSETVFVTFRRVGVAEGVEGRRPWPVLTVQGSPAEVLALAESLAEQARFVLEASA